MNLNSRNLCRLPVALLLATVAGTSFAGNLQAPLQLDKPAPLTGENVMLVVKGQGKCKNLEVSWGDGAKDVVGDFDFGGGAQSFSRPHAYANAGSFNIEVKSNGPGNKDLCAVVTQPVAVTAPGKLNNIQLDKTDAEPGENIQVTLNGQGVCLTDTLVTAHRIDPGAQQGQSWGPLMLKNATWPRKAWVKIDVPGTWEFEIRQYIGDGMPPKTDACHGKGSGPAPVVKVAAKPKIEINAAALKALNPAAPGSNTPACNTPTPQPLSTTIGPGKKVTLTGCGFGNQVGDVVAKGTFNNQAGQSRKFYIDKWTDTEIIGALPEDVSGAPDHVMHLQVVTPAGAKSTDLNANFVAKRELRVLGLNELSDFDTVNPAIYEWHRATKSESYNGGSCGTTVCMDRKLMPTPPFINAGHDHFRISLKNGWYKTSVKLVETDSGADFNLMGTTTGPKPVLTDESAGTEVKATVKWGVLGPLGWIRYRLQMEIEGPRGVPFK